MFLAGRNAVCSRPVWFQLTRRRGKRSVSVEESRMKKASLLLAGTALLFVATAALHAQGGCVNSPENPTAILAVVGSAGAFFFSRIRRFK